MKQIIVTILIAAVMLATPTANAQFTVTKDTISQYGMKDAYIGFIPSGKTIAAFIATYTGSKATYDFSHIMVTLQQEKIVSGIPTHVGNYKYLKDIYVGYRYKNSVGQWIYDSQTVPLISTGGNVKKVELSLPSITPQDKKIYFFVEGFMDYGIDTMFDYIEPIGYISGHDSSLSVTSAGTVGQRSYVKRVYKPISLRVPDRTATSLGYSIESANLGIVSLEATETNYLQLFSNGKIGNSVAPIYNARVLDNTNTTIGTATYNDVLVTIYFNPPVFTAKNDTLKFKVLSDMFNLMPGDYVRMAFTACGDVLPFETVTNTTYTCTNLSPLGETVTYKPPTFIETPAREALVVRQTSAHGILVLITRTPAIMTDITGRVVKRIPGSTAEQTIDVSDLASGMYIVSAQGVAEKISVSN